MHEPGTGDLYVLGSCDEKGVLGHSLPFRKSTLCKLTLRRSKRALEAQEDIVASSETHDPNFAVGVGVWEHFTVRDGLPDMKIESLAEDRHGNIWIGTHDCGVARFDGNEFRRFDHADGLSGEGVYCIVEDQQGNLVLGTNRGLAIFDGTKFECARPSENFGFLWGGCRDDTGALLFGVDRRPGKPAAFFRLTGDTGELVELRGPVKAAGESVNGLTFDASGTLWLSADTLYRVQDRSLTPFPTVKFPRGILALDDGKLLVAASSGVWSISKGHADLYVDMSGSGANMVLGSKEEQWTTSYDGKLHSVSMSRTCLVKDFGRPVQALLVASNGCLWAGVYGMGLFRCDQPVWQVYQTGDDGEVVRPSSLSLNGPELWVGSDRGLWCKANQGLRRVPLPLETQEITTVCSGGKNEVWIGTRHGIVAHGKSGDFQRCQRPAGLPPNRITDLTVDPKKKRIWYLCSPGWGVGFYHSPEKVRHFGPKNKEGFPAWIGAMHMSQTHGILIGSAEGKGDNFLYSLNDKIAPIGSIGDSSVSAIVDTGDVVYIGTNRGLLQMREGKIEVVVESRSLPCKVITCLSVDSQGTLWIGTEGAGIGRFDGRVLQVLEIPGGPLNNIIRDIAVEADCTAWLATEGGLLRYRPRKSKPKHIRAQTDAGGATDETHILRLPNGGGSLRLSARGGSPRTGGMRYRYRILPSTPDWNVTDGEISVRNLSPGDYSLQVQAVDPDLNYSEVANFRLQVEDADIDLYVREALGSAGLDSNFLGASPEIQSTIAEMLEIAKTELSVLLLGETGTGKSLAAKFLHSISERSTGPFVQVNCGAMTETLAESELFGHERGSFTGAVSRRIGKFQLANGGTIFLDEVGELPLSVQVKLLHVLQDGRIEPVGSTEGLDVDVRVVSATNQDLDTAVASGSFRKDLFYRLNMVPIVLPPLRERRGDVLLLAQHFIERFARELRRGLPVLEGDAAEALVDYEWPGNVRELEHVIHRAVVLSDGVCIDLVHLSMERTIGSPASQSNRCFETLNDHEREYLIRVLHHTGGRIQGNRGAARILGINPSTLRSRLKKLGLL